MKATKRFYVTKKQVKDYIQSLKNRFLTMDELDETLRDVISDLEEYPEDNKNQIKFFIRIRGELKHQS